MSRADDDQYYSKLPISDLPVGELLVEDHLFYRLPEDWHIVITDIKNSTAAVQSGQHRIVNLVAAGSIIAALNMARKRDILIPFFFGGDGATMIVPGSMVHELVEALNQLSANTKRDFNLDLRVGKMPVQAVYAQSLDLRISKVRLFPIFHIPLLLGNGLRYAEERIKEETKRVTREVAGLATLDLEGMECRWDVVKPPLEKEEVVCLLVDVPADQMQGPILKKVLDAIEDIYGDQRMRNPISTPRLKLKTTLDTIRDEMRVRLGRSSPVYLLKNWILTLSGKWYFNTKSGRTYINNLVQLSDTLVLDGRLNTVISGQVSQRDRLIGKLATWEAAGELHFGIHISSESIISCYMRDRQNQHIHFVDGAGGGYTQAAKMLKEKLLTGKTG